MDRIVGRPLAVSLALVAAAAASPGARQDQAIGVTPAVVEMATFGGGGGVRIEGVVDARAQVVVAIRGRETEAVLNRKGRFGPIWVNSGKVTVSAVPSLFLVFSSAPLSTILTPEALRQAALDEAAPTRRMAVHPPEADTGVLRDDYVALRTAEGAYRRVEGAVRLEAPSGSRRRYGLDLRWPTTAQPDDYTATVYECRGGAVTRTASAGLKVTQVGVAALMRRLADRHGAAYGTMAVAVAMLLGFGIDNLVARVRRARARRSPQRAASSAHDRVRAH